MNRSNRIVILDTTLRDGELTPGVQMSLDQKMGIAKLLDAMRVDVIEVGYPGAYQKDIQAVSAIAQQSQNSTICALAGSKLEDIELAAQAIAPATRGRLHVYTMVNLNHSRISEADALETVRTTVSSARNACDDVEWSAFDAPRSNPDFLCRAVETAIAQGATTINIPDSMGLCSPEKFSALIRMIVDRVPNIDQAVISVHCHDDLGRAVENSLAALDCGARQIECAINGLGARKGNADLAEVLDAIRCRQGTAIAAHSEYQVNVDCSLLDQASKLVAQVAGSC